MTLSLKDPETDSLARQVASLTGETPTQAVREALRDRLKNERVRRGSQPFDLGKLDEIFRQLAASPILDPRPADEIIGYDEHGLPR